MSTQAAASQLLESGHIVVSVFMLFVGLLVTLVFLLFRRLDRAEAENRRLVDMLSENQEKAITALAALETTIKLLPSEMMKVIGK